MFETGEFFAEGTEAMDAQESILVNYNRAVTVRTVAGYVASVAFACLSAAVILFAPEHRTLSAMVVAFAFLALAVGLAGFTRFKASSPALKIDAGSN
jgi:hypothetical protein